MRETASANGQRPESIARLAALSQSRATREATAASNREKKRTHGLSRAHPLYGTWQNMMTRCYNQNFKQFKDWGGRGIKVCDRWHDPALFIEDIMRLIGPRPAGMTLDRYPDNDGNYEEGNVRWASWEEQNRNTRKYKGGVGNNGSDKPLRQAGEVRSGPLYQLWWRLMKQRPEEVCDRWHDWLKFRDDIENVIGPRLPGQRFYRLDVSKPYKAGNVAWVTGVEQIKRAQAARWGESRPEPKHGMFGHPLYHTWRALVNGHPGRVHEPWQDVRMFVKGVEAELGPKPEGTVFRLIDPDGRYEPGNVCWGKRGRPRRKIEH